MHITNIINSDLSGLGLPIQVELDRANTQPESGVALAIRWVAPMVDLYRIRQEQYKHSETALARLVARIAGIAAGSDGLVASADSIELDLDFPEPHLPIPSPERDAQDQLEVDQGWKSVISVIMERFGKTRSGAIEYLRQVRIDQAELVALGPVATPAPPTVEAPEDERLEEELEAGQQGSGGPDVGPDNTWQGAIT